MEGFWLGMASPGCNFGAACAQDDAVAQRPSTPRTTTFRIVFLQLTSWCLLDWSAPLNQKGRWDIARWELPGSKAGKARSLAANPVSRAAPSHGQWKCGYCLPGP